MLTAVSSTGVTIRLSDERWQHINRRHPEVANFQDKVLETVSAPDFIQVGESGEYLAIRWYATTDLGSKYLVVAYREIEAQDGFVLTAYLTRRPSKRRRVLWTR
jgi:hypothetical protein